MTVKMKVELLDHKPISTYLMHLLSNFSFPDTLIICSNGKVMLNRIMVGLIFPHLKDTFPFTSMTDVTLVLDDCTLEQFWRKGAAALGIEEAVNKDVIDTENEQTFSGAVDANFEGGGLSPLEHICEVCQQKFQTENNLVNHMQNYHMVDIPVKCQISSKCKVRSINLPEHKAHIENFHNDEIPCHECGKLITKANLDEHIETHAKEEGYLETEGDKSGDALEVDHIQEWLNKNNTEPDDGDDLNEMNHEDAKNMSLSIEVDELRKTVEEQEKMNKLIKDEITAKTDAIRLFENLEIADFVYEKENIDVSEETIEDPTKNDRRKLLPNEDKMSISEVDARVEENDKYKKELMLQKVLLVDMKFPSMTLALSYIYNWCDDNLSPMVVEQGHANRYDSSDRVVLACPFGSRVEKCPVRLEVIQDDLDLKISELYLEHEDHEISYRLYQQFKKPKQIKDLETDHKSIVEGLFKCGFTVADIKEYFSGYNNSDVSLKDLLSLCSKAKQGSEEKALEHKCEVCQHKFKTEYKLVCHMQAYHMIDMPVKCKKCKIRSINLHEHKAHIESFHSERVPCNECRKLIAKANIKAHTESHISSKEIFACPVCDFQTNKRTYLETHMNKHSDKKNYECRNCDKKFTWSSSLKSHMLAAHSKLNMKFICEICTHSFKDGGNLKKHMFTHKEDRPHICERCGKGWIRADFLKNHKCSALL